MITAKKTIVVQGVTIHTQGPDFLPVEYDANNIAIRGKYDVIAVPPGTPVELDAAEADRILDIHGGMEIDPKTGETIREIIAKRHRDQPAFKPKAA